jgi:diguanylate cyclase (GGDEF)-like protein
MWACAFLERFTKVPVGFEQVLHQLVVVLETAHDRAAVEEALLQAVRKMAPATRIELIPASGQADGKGPSGGERPERLDGRPGDQTVLEFPLQCGAVVRGRLRICSEDRGRSAITNRTSRRLLTLCTLAASALEKFHRPSEWPWENDSTSHADHSHVASDCNGVHADKEFVLTSMLHDATFLSAVLPFALGQALRHREPLSLLCVAIDRLAGIQELMGRAAVDPLVRRVGETVAALLRSSDIVARLDDDRIVAILPRATGKDALFVAERIRRDVADKHRAATVVPAVTVSIGVATFPTCAHNVSSLFNAADEALAQARSQGRNQAVLAPPRSIPQPTPHAHARIHNLLDELAKD